MTEHPASDPSASALLPVVRVRAQRARPLFLGHPRLRRDSVGEPPVGLDGEPLVHGALVQVVAWEGQPIAPGLWCPEGADAVWLLPGLAEADRTATVGVDGWHAAILAAIARRPDPSRAGGSQEGQRLVHSTGDGLAGVWLDRLGPRWGLSLAGPAVTHELAIRIAVERVLGGDGWVRTDADDGVVEDLDAGADEAGQRVGDGGVPLSQRVWRARGSDWLAGRTLRRWARGAVGKSVLDGLPWPDFSVSALAHGATQATWVDGGHTIADPTARWWAAQSGVEVLSHTWSRMAQRAQDRQQTWDVVAGVATVPAGADSRAATRSIDQQAWSLLRLVAPQGLLALRLDGGQGDDEPWMQALAQAGAKLQRRVAVLERHRQDVDMPVMAAERETRPPLMLLVRVT